MGRHIEKNDIYQGRVIDLNSEGQGVVKLEGVFPVFIPGALVGEEVSFKIGKAKKSYAFGILLEVLEASPHRVSPRDDLGRQTGTMTLQHMDYPSQLAFKKKQVQEALSRIGGFNQPPVEATLGMEDPWAYRNKAQIPVREVKGRLETGFYRKRTHDLVPVENFHIQYPTIDQAILKVRDLLRDYGLSAYDEETGQGLIRHIIVRQGHYSRDMMVILVVNGTQLPREEALVQNLVQTLPDLVSLVLNVNQKKTNVILGPDSRILWGKPYYQDQMLGLKLRISPQSFYQVNTPQAEKLYQAGIQAAGLTGQERVLDAYCGIGSISLALAQKAKEVYAMEVVPQAVDMARENARINGIENAHFQAGKAEKILPQWQKQGLSFDVAFVDPPRKGLDPRFIESLVQLAPKKIVYISCNPSTLARDCKIISQAGYSLDYVQPVDLFPQTNHVETVALLSKLDVDKHISVE
ncbi:MAG: 23S rRNA (uracil(1939)-C(5))-methyltransferase RlmD, partial [Tissierellia bacterium]|nr:23S rRNA (uracil(1939)-C(5))-methyltransferase RlmD [Tissierellia bacterium]